MRAAVSATFATEERSRVRIGAAAGARGGPSGGAGAVVPGDISPGL
jgi:hypothetical protein